MDALISLVYTIIDSVCVCLFLDAFASHRWRDNRFLVGVIVQTILMYASIEFSVIVLNRNQIVKIFLILLTYALPVQVMRHPQKLPLFTPFNPFKINLKIFLF